VPQAILVSNAESGSGFGFVRAGLIALPELGVFAVETSGNVGSFEATIPHEFIVATGGGAIFTAGVSTEGATVEKITLQQFALGDGSIEKSGSTFEFPAAVSWEGCSPESTMLASNVAPAIEIGSSLVAEPSAMSAPELQFAPTTTIPEPSALMWLPLLAIPLARRSQRIRNGNVTASPTRPV
jgi:hypothetical protein